MEKECLQKQGREATKARVNKRARVVDKTSVSEHGWPIEIVIGDKVQSAVQKAVNRNIIDSIAAAGSEKAHDNNEACNYENEREERIRMNREKMKELGIVPNICSPMSLTSKLHAMAANKQKLPCSTSKAQSSVKVSTNVSTRRSLR